MDEWPTIKRSRPARLFAHNRLASFERPITPSTTLSTTFLLSIPELPTGFEAMLSGDGNLKSVIFEVSLFCRAVTFFALHR
jgi:hypothetical protein